jgi:hypothetical protein
MKPAVSAVLGLALLLLAGGCRPKVGSRCDQGEARCLDGKTVMVCQAGTFISAPCKGPQGCALTAKGTACDASGNAAGDPCSKDDEGASTCDGKVLVKCVGGAYARSECQGPRGCEVVGNNAVCDTTIAAAGATCVAGARACSTDGKDSLTCQDGKLVVAHHCRGPSGCKAESGKLSCDMSAAAIDDPCTDAMSGNVACSADGAQILICKGKRFAIDEVCKKGTRCDAARDSITCAKE